MIKFALFLFVFCIGLTSHAEVLRKSDTGFNLLITADVPQSSADVYDQFVRIDEWWDKNHSYFGADGKFSLQVKAGGCFCEVNGPNEVLHMLVSFVHPGLEIRMVGGLGPLQMLGVHGGMSWAFADLPEGGTRITQIYNVTGYMDGGLGQLAEIVDKVQTGQLNALVAQLNK